MVRMRQLLKARRPDPDMIPEPRTLEKCNNIVNDNVNTICERPDCVKIQPDMSDNDFLANIVGGRAIDISDGGNPRISKRMRHSQGVGGGTEADNGSYIQERTQASSITYINNTSGGILNLNTPDLAPGLAADMR